MALNDSTIAVLSIMILLLTLFLRAVLSRKRRTPFALRRITAYETVPLLVGQAIEADRPLHLSLGSAGVGGESTMLALAGAELAFQVMRQAVVGDASPIITVSDPSALPLAQATLRRAYLSRNLPARYQATNARWFPVGTRSLAFAAAITAMMSIENAASDIMAGSFGAELALVMAAGQRRNTPVYAVSDQVTGQAVAYAMADAPIIGEEIFFATPYIAENKARASEAVVMDVLRWVLILAMLAGLAATIANKGG